MKPFARLPVDGFTLSLFAAVGLASVLPVHGAPAEWFGWATQAAIALMFFLQGARFSRQTVMSALGHWRLHLTVFAITFVIFPFIGLVIGWLPTGPLAPPLALGLVFMTCLPSTMQTAVAFTSVAGGNVPAAAVSASISNLLGVVLTPFLISLLLSASGGGVSLDALLGIFYKLFLPFVVGQVLYPLIGGWTARHRGFLALVDRGSIVMVVYSAFSAAAVKGVWSQTPPSALALVFIACAVLLGLVLMAITWGCRRLGFSRADEAAIVFCGSNKSMANGIPIANILFAGQAVGLIVLPVMILHQLQLMLCSFLARRYAMAHPVGSEPGACDQAG